MFVLLVAMLVAAPVVVQIPVAAAASGGPDAFGYSFVDSNSGGPAFNFQDISSTGAITGVQCDDCQAGVTIPFSYIWYGVSYTTVTVSSNGYVCFGPSPSCSQTGGSVPTLGEPSNLLAAYWRDLHPSCGGDVRHQTLGSSPNRVFIIQWTNVQYYFCQPSTVTMQIKLFEASALAEVHYQNVAGGGAAAGTENAGGTIGLAYPIGTSAISNLAVAYTRDVTAPRTLDASQGTAVGDVSLSWQQPLSDGGSPITSYRIYRGTSPSGLALHTSVGGTQLTFTDSVLQNGTTYYYEVSAVNALIESPRSNQDSSLPKPDTVTGPSSFSINPTRLWTGDASTVAFSYTVTASECPTSSTCPVANEWRIYLDGTPNKADGTLLTSGTNNHPGHATAQTYSVSQAVNPTGPDGAHKIKVAVQHRQGSTQWIFAETPLTIDAPLPGTMTGPSGPTLSTTSIFPGQSLRIQSTYGVFQKQCKSSNSCPITNDWKMLLDGTAGQPDGTVLFSGSNNHPAHGETQTYNLDRTHTFGAISTGTHLIKIAARKAPTDAYTVVGTTITVRSTEASTTPPNDFLVHPEYMFSGNARVAFNYSVTSMTCAAPLSCDSWSNWQIRLDGTQQNGDYSNSAFDGTVHLQGIITQPSHGEIQKNFVDRTITIDSLAPGVHWVKAGVRALETDTQNWRVRTAMVTTLVPDDGDADGVPDSLEAQLCGREIERILIGAAPGGSAGACLSTTNYDPPLDTVTFQVPSKVMPGPDADNDGFPAYVDVYYTRVFINRTAPASASVTDGGTSRHDIDLFDSDPNRPVISIVCTLAPFPSGVSANQDADNDDFPAFAAITQSTACVDRTTPSSPYYIEPAGYFSSTGVDPNDNDPNNPVQSYFNVTNIPVNATFGKDKDRDGLPGYKYVRYANLSYDRRDPANPIVTYWIDATKFDPDDNNRNNPVPFAAVDNDADFIPDGAEPAICLIQDANMDEDGDCVGGNYLPPSWYQMVLDRVFA